MSCFFHRHKKNGLLLCQEVTPGALLASARNTLPQRGKGCFAREEEVRELSWRVNCALSHFTLSLFHINFFIPSNVYNFRSPHLWSKRTICISPLLSSSANIMLARLNHATIYFAVQEEENDTIRKSLIFV